jgi:hypothetical protein
MPAEIHVEPAGAFRYRIPRDPSRGMRTDVIVFASEALIAQIRKDLSLEQAMNVATLPGITGPSLAMPDIHQGYGFPIGGVAATDVEYQLRRTAGPHHALRRRRSPETARTRQPGVSRRSLRRRWIRFHQDWPEGAR